VLLFFLIFLCFCNFFLDEKDIYIAEDGLQHLAPTYIPEIFPYYYIILNKNSSEITMQRLIRAKTKPSTYIEFLFESDALKKYFISYYEKYQSKLKNIQNNRFNINTIVIDCDKDDAFPILVRLIDSLNEQK
jgi:hypothetical protein